MRYDWRIVGVLCALVPALIGSPAAAADPAAQLVVQSADAQLGTSCDLSGPVVIVTAVIANVGDAISAASTDTNAVVVVDKFAPWSAGASLPELPPGASVSVTLSLFAYNPTQAAGLHRFTVLVNRDKKIPESDYANNQSKPINVSVPAKLCSL